MNTYYEKYDKRDKPMIYKSQWRYGYHYGLEKFFIDPLDKFFERENIDLSDSLVWFTFDRIWKKEFNYNFSNKDECKRYLMEHEKELREKAIELFNRAKEEIELERSK